MKSILKSLLVFCLVTVSYAANQYVPPAKMTCSKAEDAGIVCDGMNRAYFSEDSTNVSFGLRDQTFRFYSASAYMTPDKQEATIYYTYQTLRFKWVKFKSVVTYLRPDFNDGWKQRAKDFYVCEGDARCSVLTVA